MASAGVGRRVPDGVAIRDFAGWYQTRFAHARRVIE